MPNRELSERARMFEERAERATDPISRQHLPGDGSALQGAINRADGHAGTRDGALSAAAGFSFSPNRFAFLIVVYFSEMHQSAFEPCIPTPRNQGS